MMMAQKKKIRLHEKTKKLIIRIGAVYTVILNLYILFVQSIAIRNTSITFFHHPSITNATTLWIVALLAILPITACYMIMEKVKEEPTPP